MSRSRDIDDQINALAREKERYMEEARLSREYREREKYQRGRTDNRELPLVSSPLCSPFCNAHAL